MNLKCETISKQYRDIEALKEFSYDFTPGVYGLLGPNGAGKTTLISILTDNLRQTSGEIMFDGSDIHELGREYRKNIGYVPQQQQVFPGFTLRRFLLYISGLKNLNRKEAALQIYDIVKKVNLENVMDRKLSELSGGMKQRAMLAQALLGNPQIIILDEPTAGLDPNERIRFRNVVSKMSLEKIVIFATHVVSDIQFIAGKVIIMNKGQIVTEGAPWKLCSQIRGKVFEIKVDERELDQVERKFKIGDMLKEDGKIYVRIVSDIKPDEFECVEKEPSLEDVYLYLV